MESISRSCDACPRVGNLLPISSHGQQCDTHGFSGILRQTRSTRNHALRFVSCSHLSVPYSAQTRDDSEDPHPFSESVPPGTRISYGGVFKAKRKSLIATLPIGYADGYSHHLSNHGEVLIHGKRAPVVGRSVWISSWWMSPISPVFQ